jgi:nucleoside-diphosphate-sugar epimerase
MVQLSLERIKSLGWTQTISEEEGLRRTVRWTLKDRKPAK